MNALAGRAVFHHADVVLVIGSRFVNVLTPTASWPAGRIRFIHVNVDPADLGAPSAPEVAIAAERVKRRTVLPEGSARSVKAWADTQIALVEPQASYVRLRAAMPEDAVFVQAPSPCQLSTLAGW